MAKFFFDIISHETIDVDHHSAKFYLVQLTDGRYKLCATTQSPDSPEMGNGCPYTRLTEYWPIAGDQIDKDNKKLFPEVLMSDAPLTLEELNKAVNFNPPFDPNTPQMTFGVSQQQRASFVLPQQQRASFILPQIIAINPYNQNPRISVAIFGDPESGKRAFLGSAPGNIDISTQVQGDTTLYLNELASQSLFRPLATIAIERLRAVLLFASSQQSFVDLANHLLTTPSANKRTYYLINYSEQNEITGFTKVDNQEIPDAVPRIIDFTNVGNPMNFRRSDGTEEQRQGILSSLLEHIHFIDNSPGNVGHP